MRCDILSLVIVEVNDLRVDLDGTSALAPVSFRVKKGRCLAVVGENGTGKTTLLRVLAGLQQPTGGSVTVGGLAADEQDPNFRTMVAAHIGPPPAARDLTVREHLELVARTWGAEPEAATRATQEVVDDLGLGELTERLGHQMSTGQRQAFGLALTLSRPSQVLLLDEPEHGLDPHRTTHAIAALKDRLAHGATVIIATHAPRFADELADEILGLASP